MDYENLTGYSQTLAELDAATGSIEKLYTYADQIKAQTDTTGPTSAGRTYQTDALGSVRGLTSAGITEQYNYTAFGEPIQGASSLTSSSYAFTGQRRDADTGMQYHRARWLAELKHNWASADAVFDFEGTFGNVTCYRHADPVNGVDLMGTIGSQAEFFAASSGQLILFSILVVAAISVAFLRFYFQEWRYYYKSNGEEALPEGVSFLRRCRNFILDHPMDSRGQLVHAQFDSIQSKSMAALRNAELRFNIDIGERDAITITWLNAILFDEPRLKPGNLAKNPTIPLGVQPGQFSPKFARPVNNYDNWRSTLTMLSIMYHEMFHFEGSSHDEIYEWQRLYFTFLREHPMYWQEIADEFALQPISPADFDSIVLSIWKTVRSDAITGAEPPLEDPSKIGIDPLRKTRY